MTAPQTLLLLIVSLVWLWSLWQRWWFIAGVSTLAMIGILANAFLGASNEYSTPAIFLFYILGFWIELALINRHKPDRQGQA